MRTLACTLIALCMPMVVYASHGDGPLININTADSALLDTLDGIGPTIAGRIIDYRTQNGPFAAIEDIANVSGIGGPGSVSYGKIQDHITVKDATSTSTSTASASTGSGAGGTVYQYDTVTIQPPEDIFIRTKQELHTVPYASTHFSIESYDAKGAVTQTGSIVWAFGDGAEAYGRSAIHQYEYEGEYTAIVTLTEGTLSDEVQVVVHVLPLEASFIVANDGSWVEIHNTSEYSLDISSWRLIAGGSYFSFPQKTVIAPGAHIRFPKNITKLTAYKAFPEARIVYPNGKTALTGTRESDVTQQEGASTATSSQSVSTTKSVVIHTEGSTETSTQHAATHTTLPAIRVPPTLTQTSYTAPDISQESSRLNKMVPNTMDTTQSQDSPQIAAAALSDPLQKERPMSFWYGILALVLLASIVGLLSLPSKKLIVEGFEVVEK